MSPATVDAAGIGLAFEERGSGDPAVLIHGTGTDRSLWRETVGELGDSVRSIVYDRRGYGESGAPEHYAGTTVEEQAEDAAALIAALDAGAVLACGHGLGAVVCLDLLRRHPARVRGAVLVEPLLLSLSQSGSGLVGALREAVEEGARDGGSGGAVGAYVSALGGGGALARLGPERLSAAGAAVRAFAADVGATSSWSFGRRDLRSLDAPVIVLSGEASNPVLREVAAELVGLVPAAELRTAPAGHFLPLDAPADVAAAIEELAGR